MCKVAFYKGLSAPGRDWTDWLICKWTHGPYSHVELVIDGDGYSSSPEDGKVRKTKHTIDEETWDYIDIEYLNESDILKFFMMTKGSKYDWLGILGFIIPFKDRTNKWFCSEWVSNAMKISGCVRLWKLEPSKISPNKLYRILI